MKSGFKNLEKTGNNYTVGTRKQNLDKDNKWGLKIFAKYKLANFSLSHKLVKSC